jgi:hypothetical protein
MAFYPKAPTSMGPYYYFAYPSDAFEPGKQTITVKASSKDLSIQAFGPNPNGFNCSLPLSLSDSTKFYCTGFEITK